VRLNVLTFNVGNGLAGPSRLADLLARARTDLVGLQELAPSQAEALAGDLASLYPYQVLAPTGFSGKGVLSRFPILSHEGLHLYPGRPDLRVMAEIGGTTLQVLVAHPPPPRLTGARFGFDPQAAAQLATLAELALEHSPSVLLGDFNMTPRHPVYARFVAAGLVDAFAAAGAGRGWTLPRRVGNASPFRHGLHRVPLRPVARVDYIWCTPGVQAEAAWVGDDAGSDHLPVGARLVLPLADVLPQEAV
jgi:endonuclease/exonuclease/phosphatase family metal-dependent hydrolase